MSARSASESASRALDREQFDEETIAQGVNNRTCSHLESYWHYHGCGYKKSAHTCAMPHLMQDCAVPSHNFRNGNLNQLAYSLFLFIVDIADGDLVAWIDGRLAEANHGPDDDRIERMAAAIIEPLAGVHGASGKVLNMALADLLVVGNDHNPLWGELGGCLIAIDTLVHNFLVRTGILARMDAAHAYGPQCYGPRGCAALLRALSAHIDARQFNGEFPKFFPRYVQRSIWAYCAAEELNVCNGRTVRDSRRCANRHCRLFANCDRLALAPPRAH
jgi:hypothetical protein